MKKVLLIGNGAREHIIAAKLLASSQKIELVVFASSLNPGIKKLARVYQVGDLKDNQAMVRFAVQEKVNWAIIGPEAPLGQGLVDDLAQKGIKAIGPIKELAQIETSKSFTRELLKEYLPNLNPELMIFQSMAGVEEWLQHLEESFVIKPDGLTSGKGVKVSGDHFQNMNEGLAIIEDLFSRGNKVIIEEKLIGQEFSLMSLTDGENLIHLPAVQDNKRALVDDRGPNTGGMGSYSCADFSLPFLTAADIKQAQQVNEQVVKVLKEKVGQPYQGILYGNFIAVKNGIKLIEYNARFGDPEAMNVMTVLKSDFVEICEGIINSHLDKVRVEFEKVSTVCKYLVPEGYPQNPVKDVTIDVSQIDQTKVDVYFAAIDERSDGLYLTGSRALALVAKHQDLYAAERIVEEEIQKVIGPVNHRADIGTRELIERRIKMMKELRL